MTLRSRFALNALAALALTLPFAACDSKPSTSKDVPSKNPPTKDTVTTPSVHPTPAPSPSPSPTPTKNSKE